MRNKTNLGFDLSNPTDLGWVMGSAFLYPVNPTRPDKNRLNIFFYSLIWFILTQLPITSYQHFHSKKPNFIPTPALSFSAASLYFDLLFTSSVHSLVFSFFCTIASWFSASLSTAVVLVIWQQKGFFLSDLQVCWVIVLCCGDWWVNYIIFLRFTRFLLGF